MSDIIEVAVFIHGVSGDLKGKEHTKEYEALHRGIREHNSAFPENYLGIEWGWKHERLPSLPEQLLSDAQRHLGSRTMPAVDMKWDFTLNPARIAINSFRPIIFYNFADMFYYVCKEGKDSVRQSVANQIVDGLKPYMDQPDSKISLTLLGHSAGSIIAFDLLFSLFYPNSDGDHEYLPADKEPGGLKELRAMVNANRLRVRRLFTFGSPITPFACRSNAVVKILAKDEQLEPEHYGLIAEPFNDPLPDARWVNIWDRDDPIGWPVEPLMENSLGLVKDSYIDVSDSVKEAHDAYWESEDVYKHLAEAW